MLQLCTSQTINEVPFAFKATGIRVYSIEEALYHVYHHWRESAEEFLSAKMIAWVESLGHPRLAREIKGFTRLESLSKQMLAFLGIIEYFDKSELTSLKTDLESWEHRVEWERLKDRADRLVAKGNPARALPLYRQALKYEENALLLNNMAIAHMKAANYKEGAKLLAKAHALWPDNNPIRLHYAEAVILSGDYEKAATILEEIRLSYPDDPGVMFLRGLMAYGQKDYTRAINWLEKAAAIAAATPSIENSKTLARCVSKITDIYIQTGQYDKALASLNPKSPDYHIKAAEIYAAQGHAHMPDAIQHMRKAIETAEGSPALWAKLAKYYRLDYDYQRAEEAIAKALPSDNETILLENARIKKGLSRMRDYRAGLSDVLKGLRDRYREG